MRIVLSGTNEHAPSAPVDLYSVFKCLLVSFIENVTIVHTTHSFSEQHRERIPTSGNYNGKRLFISMFDC